MLAVAGKLGVVVAAWSTLLTKCVPVGMFAGLTEFGIAVVRCVTLWLWVWTVERSGCVFVKVGDEGRGREKAWNMEDDAGGG